uniref:Putative WD repeat-containing protein F21H12.1 n=1 Tax=Lygus hesperus TaxID=30085 RepID=A0A0A9XSH6_LYGHE
MLNSPVRVLRFAPSLVVTCAVGTYDGRIALLDYAGNQVQATITSLHRHPITCLNYTDDGREMVSGDAYGGLQVSYAGVTGTLVSSLNGHRGAVTEVLFCNSTATSN